MPHKNRLSRSSADEEEREGRWETGDEREGIQWRRREGTQNAEEHSMIHSK
jgi:hypothetical protein